MRIYPHRSQRFSVIISWEPHFVPQTNQRLTGTLFFEYRIKQFHWKAKHGLCLGVWLRSRRLKDTGMLLWYCRSRFISPRCFYGLPILWGGPQYLLASIFNGYSFIKIMLRIWIFSGYSMIFVITHLAQIIKFRKIFIFSMEWKLKFEMRFFKKSRIAFKKIQKPRFNNFH